jgi:resuscitation-promoting factor RpfB
LNPKIDLIAGKNIVHFAAWIPGTNSVAYSTVEPRSAAPGWQANNDLYRVSITGGTPRRLLSANSGGVYGWWGMSFAYSHQMAGWRMPDPMASDWWIRMAAISNRCWTSPRSTPTVIGRGFPPSPGARMETVYTSSAMRQRRRPLPARSRLISTSQPPRSAMKRQCPSSFGGMFSYPSVSPIQTIGREKSFQVAYLQSIFIEQSDTSRYRLMVMDRDGSNSRLLFPPADANGIEPQIPAWAPAPIEGHNGDFLAVVYQGNLWLVDSGSGNAYQVTG